MKGVAWWHQACVVVVSMGAGSWSPRATVCQKEEPVRRLLVLITVVILVLVTAGTALAASGPAGPAPNSGDCSPDGSGLDGHYGEVDSGMGPAPSSGDGDSDGSGF